MPVYCTSCGGELFGAVNRCWHCRRSFAKPPAQDGRPAVRRAPVIVEGLAPIAEGVVPGEAAPGLTLPAKEKAGKSAKPKPADDSGQIAVGSPFSPGWTLPKSERGRAAPPPETTFVDPDADELGRWGAVLGVVCGGGGLFLSAWNPWPVALAWIGITLASLGLKNYRVLAAFGLFLSCLVLYVQGFLFSRELFTSVFKVDPWTAIFGK